MAGHVLGVVLAHDRAVRCCPGGNAVVGQLPMPGQHELNQEPAHRPRMLAATLPYADAWNAWYADTGN